MENSLQKGGFVVLSINRKFPYGYLVSTSEQLGDIIRNINQPKLTNPTS